MQIKMFRLKMQKKRDGKPVQGNVKVIDVREETYKLLLQLDVRKITVLKEFIIEL